MKRMELFKVTGPTAAAAGTAIVAGTTTPGFSVYDWFEIDAEIVAGAGGTSDIIVWRQLETNVWVEVAHFPQVAAGATKYYSLKSQAGAAMVEVAKTDDTGPGTSVLAVNTWVSGHLGDKIRVTCVRGVGASNAGSVTLYVRAFVDQT